MPLKKLKPLISLIVEQAPPPAKPWPWYDEEPYEPEEDAGEVTPTDESFARELYDDAHEGAFTSDPYGESVNPQDE